MVYSTGTIKQSLDPMKDTFFCMYGWYSLSKLRETYIHLNYHCMRYFLSYYCRHLILLILIDRHMLSEGGKSYPEGNQASAIFTSKEKD